MAFHRWPEICAKPIVQPGVLGYVPVIITLDWDAMMPDKKVLDAGIIPDSDKIGELMYIIGCHVNAHYIPGTINKGGASTSAYRNNAKIAFKNMGYENPGNFKAYNFSDVKSSIKNAKPKPVLADGYTAEINIFGIHIPSGSGHAWVIDLIQTMSLSRTRMILPVRQNLIIINIAWE